MFAIETALSIDISFAIQLGRCRAWARHMFWGTAGRRAWSSSCLST